MGFAANSITHFIAHRSTRRRCPIPQTLTPPLPIDVQEWLPHLNDCATSWTVRDPVRDKQNVR